MKQKKKRPTLTPEQKLREAFKYAKYIIKTNANTYLTAEHFKTNASTVSGRLKLLIEADPCLYKEVCNVCPRLGTSKEHKTIGRASGEITNQKKKVAAEKEKKRTVTYSQSTGYTIVELGHKKTPKYKCKSLSGRSKGGRWSYNVAVKPFFTEGYQRFTVKADSPKKAIAQVQLMVKHYGLKWLNPNACWIEGAN